MFTDNRAIEIATREPLAERPPTRANLRPRRWTLGETPPSRDFNRSHR